MIGMKLLEFGDGQFPEVYDILMRGMYLLFWISHYYFTQHICNLGNGAPLSTMSMHVMETEAFNDTHERWCQSKELISLTPLVMSRIQYYFICVTFWLKIISPTVKISNTCTETYMYFLEAQIDVINLNYQGFIINHTGGSNAYSFACL
jgi:hypothetical protein